MFFRLLAAVFAVLCISAAPATKSLTVLAAISLRDVIAELTPAFESANGVKVDVVLGASGQLAMQAKNGAPGDVFISAARKQVDELVAAQVAEEASRVVIATNTLVLVAPADGLVKSFEDLRKARRIAIGEPKSVPAGQYALQTLAVLKLDVADKLVYGTNVKQVADYVARGEVDAGVVYATDASVSKLNVVATAPADSHDPIEYPAVVLTNAREPALANAYLAYLQTEPARAILAKHGFSPTTRPTE